MMTFKRTATSAAALSLCLTGSAAFADLSAQDVWQDWKNYMSGFGYEVEGTESTSGDTLTVSDISMAMELPDDAGAFDLTISAFSFTDNGDGTVTMTMPDVNPMTISVTGPGEDVSMSLDYTTDDFAMVASGDTTELTYAYTANELGLNLTEMTVDGAPLEIGTATMTIAQLAGTSNIKNGNLRNIVQSITSGPVTYAMDFKDPEMEGDSFVFNGSLAGMNFEGSGDYPLNVSSSDMVALFEAGFGFDGTFTHSGSTLEMNVTEFGQTTMINTASESGSFAVAMDPGKLLYDVSSNGMNVTMMGGGIPLPIEMAMAKSGFKAQVPISKSEDEQDFAIALNLTDFTVSDMIWGMIDPGGSLPRDPATIALDLTGKAILGFDLMDAEQMEAVDRGEIMPGELNALTLNDLQVTVAGAALTGTGDFTFDNSDLQTFDGMPAPDGSIDLSLTGANALMDNLVAMGLLPEEQAMGARMMMGLFAVPGEGEDSLTSTIEVKPDGQILANGQRLQ